MIFFVGWASIGGSLVSHQGDRLPKVWFAPTIGLQHFALAAVPHLAPPTFTPVSFSLPFFTSFLFSLETTDGSQARRQAKEIIRQ